MFLRMYKRSGVQFSCFAQPKLVQISFLSSFLFQMMKKSARFTTCVRSFAHQIHPIELHKMQYIFTWNSKVLFQHFRIENILFIWLLLFENDYEICLYMLSYNTDAAANNAVPKKLYTPEQKYKKRSIQNDHCKCIGFENAEIFCTIIQDRSVQLVFL